MAADAALPSTLSAADAGQAPCHVVLSRLSYDDPGTDDDELLELSVRGAIGGSARFQDCGLERLELVSAAPSCSVYRTLEVGQLPIAANRHLVVCVAAGALDDDLGCDLTASSIGELQPGWLQNTVGAGVHAKSGTGATVFHYTYGQGSCGASAEPAEILPLDLESSMTEDHVIALCEHGYEYLPLGAAPLRGGECQAEGGAAPAVESRANGTVAKLWDASVTTFTRPTARFLEAGLESAPEDSRQAPPELGCGSVAAVDRARGPAWGVWLSVPTLLVALRFRRRRPSSRP